MATKQPQDSEQEKRQVKEDRTGESQDREETLGPIDSVLRAIGLFLKGQPRYTGGMLRKAIIDNMPSDLSQAEVYNLTLRMMKDIGEMVSQVSNEEFLVRKSKS